MYSDANEWDAPVSPQTTRVPKPSPVTAKAHTSIIMSHALSSIGPEASVVRNLPIVGVQHTALPS